jgi:hypothetical protein
MSAGLFVLVAGSDWLQITFYNLPDLLMHNSCK